MTHHLSLLLLPIFFFISLSAQSDNSTYPNCPSHKCGDVTISYPFWNTDNAPAQFCGYQGFGIKCPNINVNQSIPDITLGGYSYYITSINYELRNMRLVDASLSSAVPDPLNCRQPRHGINLETFGFNFSMSIVNLGFHFSCNGCPSFATEIPCFNIVGRKSCVQILNTSSMEESDWDEYSCRQALVTAVLRERINRFPNLSTEFGRVLEGGFELEWRKMMMDGCDKCEESNGRCGRYNTAFICFCPDGTTNEGDCTGRIIKTLRASTTIEH